MNKWLMQMNPLLREEFEEEPYGQGGVVEEVEEPVEGQEDPPQQWQDPLADPTPSEEPALTPSQWAQIQETMGGSAQPQLQQDLDPARVDELLNVYRVDLDFAKKLFGEDANEQHVEALQSMTDGIVKHLTTVLGHTSDILRQDLSQQFSPALDMVQEQREAQFTSLLTDAYPALKGQENVIRQVTASLKAQGFQPKDGVEAGRVVAGQVEALLKTVNPQFSLAGGAPTTKTNMPPMAGQMASGGGGGAGAKAPSSKKPGWAAVFD